MVWDSVHLWLRSEWQVSILGQLHHPHVVHMYGVTFRTPHAYIIMEMCTTSLQALLQSPSEPPAFKTRVQWALHIAVGMEYLHEKGIIHR